MITFKVCISMKGDRLLWFVLAVIIFYLWHYKLSCCLIKLPSIKACYKQTFTTLKTVVVINWDIPNTLQLLCATNINLQIPQGNPLWEWYCIIDLIIQIHCQRQTSTTFDNFINIDPCCAVITGLNTASFISSGQKVFSYFSVLDSIEIVFPSWS